LINFLACLGNRLGDTRQSRPGHGPSALLSTDQAVDNKTILRCVTPLEQIASLLATNKIWDNPKQTHFKFLCCCCRAHALALDSLPVGEIDFLGNHQVYLV